MKSLGQQFEHRIQAGLLTRMAWLLVITWALAASSAEASGTSTPNQFESYSMILMLEEGPVHARFGIAMNAQPVGQRRAEFIQSLVESLDANADGQLSRDEANQSYVLRKNVSKGTQRFIKKRNLSSKQIISLSEVHRRVKQVAGQPVVFRQNDDAKSSDEFIFGLIDENGSGIIEYDEMTTAASRLFERDADNDACIGFDELQPPPENPGNPNLIALGVVEDQEERSHSVFSELLRPANDRFLPQRLLRKYDVNGNGKLSPKELKWDPKRVASIDANKDGELSRSELANVRRSPLDIDLTVDVAPASAAKPEFHILHCTGKRLDRATRPGIANLLLQNATVTISYRHVEPVPEAIENAMRKFNTLDADTNGYLDEPEITGEPLFQRGLFQRMDTDKDAKVFSEEMEAYVRERADVKAMSCKVNIYDTGSGFFQAMDHNNDGRISEREMRSSEASLQSLASDAVPGVSQMEPARRYHIEFSRGGFLLFGPNQQATKGSISFNTQVAVGPPWFTGSDRNNDGDLTWNEFLGHREDFHFLDLDQDGLIDPIEAQRAEELRTD